jgi:hypothetical protein
LLSLGLDPLRNRALVELGNFFQQILQLSGFLGIELTPSQVVSRRLLLDWIPPRIAISHGQDGPTDDEVEQAVKRTQDHPEAGTEPNHGKFGIQRINWKNNQKFEFIFFYLQQGKNLSATSSPSLSKAFFRKKGPFSYSKKKNKQKKKPPFLHTSGNDESIHGHVRRNQQVPFTTVPGPRLSKGRGLKGPLSGLTKTNENSLSHPLPEQRNSDLKLVVQNVDLGLHLVHLLLHLATGRRNL